MDETLKDDVSRMADRTMLAMLLVPALRGERSLLCHERYWDSWPPEERNSIQTRDET